MAPAGLQAGQGRVDVAWDRRDYENAEVLNFSGFPDSLFLSPSPVRGFCGRRSPGGGRARETSGPPRGALRLRVPGRRACALPRARAMAETPQLKRKRAEEEGENENGGAAAAFSLSDLRVRRVLRESARDKAMFLHAERIGLSGEGTDAVVILEKTPFQEEKIPDLLKKAMKAELQMQNDIYCTFYLSPPPELSEIKATVVYPATEKHIQKYLRHEVHLIRESWEDYQNITLPFIQSQSFSIQEEHGGINQSRAYRSLEAGTISMEEEECGCIISWRRKLRLRESSMKTQILLMALF
ncbi:m7GpppX diphosphatase isoform X3 [Pseudopipra pipra]|uniref:m7GpppX diphosphatase isoform X3 n=1 Tax=Pseudopipra pipra TaxID=415032 RepID=UPI003139C2D3